MSPDDPGPDPTDRLRALLAEHGVVALPGQHVDPSDPVTGPVWTAAPACHEALGCRHYGLFGFRVDPDGRPVFLEAGPYCSFARGSVVTTMAAAAGIDLPELFASCVDFALGADGAR